MINIDGKMELNVHPGERVIIYTYVSLWNQAEIDHANFHRPGGGAWGSGHDAVPTIPKNSSYARPSTFILRGREHEFIATAEAAQQMDCLLT